MMARSNVGLCCVFITLFLPIDYCTAEIIAVKVMKSEGMNLADFVDCDAWKPESGDGSAPVITEYTTSGLYTCPSNGKQFLLIFYGAFYFASKIEEEFNVKSTAGVLGENITLACYMEIFPGNISMTTTFSITDDNNNEVVREVYPADLSLVHDSITEIHVTASRAGNITHYCEWILDIEYEGNKYVFKDILNATVIIFTPVHGVKPDKTKVNVGESIRCIAEGAPRPDKFRWSCDYVSDEIDGWITENEVLTPKYPKEFVCLCVASNSLGGRVWSSLWNGTIEAIGEPIEMTKKPKGTKEKGKKEKDKKGDKPKLATPKREKDDTEEEEEEEEDTQDNKGQKTKHPAFSRTNSLRGIFSAGALLSFCSVVMATAG